MRQLLKKAISLTAVLCILAAGVLLGGCNFLPTEEEELAPPLMQPAKIEYKTEAVALGTLIQQVRMTGSFYAENTKALTFENQGGRLKAMHVRLGDSVKAGDLLVELDSGNIEYDIRMQEIEVEKTEISISQLKANRADKYSIRRANLELEQQEMRLAELQRQLEATRLVSPIDGEITYNISTSVGEWVNAYQIVCKVADTSTLVLITRSDKAGDLPIGAIVSVEFQKQELAGEVVANPSTLFNDPDENLRKSAIVKLTDGIPAKAALGSDARIVYVQERREDVIVLPRTQINLMSGRRYVNVLEDGVRVEKDVEVGLTTDTEAEIIKGLAVGDLVIVN